MFSVFSFSLRSTLKQLENLGLRCDQWLHMLECGVRALRPDLISVCKETKVNSLSSSVVSYSHL